jgi:hypothetical protein
MTGPSLFSDGRLPRRDGISVERDCPRLDTHLELVPIPEPALETLSSNFLAKLPLRLVVTGAKPLHRLLSSFDITSRDYAPEPCVS